MTDKEKIDITMMSTAVMVANKYNTLVNIDVKTKVIDFDCEDEGIILAIAEELAKILI